MILAIESSCDETCAAVVDSGARQLLSSVVASQAGDHAAFGGVVPEIASRRHLELLWPTVEAALADAAVGLGDLSAVAATAGPGLVGALLVGLSAAKGLSYALDVPLIPVDHLLGHVASLALADVWLPPPVVVLLASGGHTLLLHLDDDGRVEELGSTLDDAAGEAFDKGARLLGLGYPGGPAIGRMAATGDAAREPFPVPLLRRPGPVFSFSGLKTALRNRVADLSAKELEERRADLAAGYQRAIVSSLVSRTVAAALATGATGIGVVGGVAANAELRTSLATEAAAVGLSVAAAPLAFCGDNAAMIGMAAIDLPRLRFPETATVDAYARRASGALGTRRVRSPSPAA